jgi:hypothetical protein
MARQPPTIVLREAGAANGAQLVVDPLRHSRKQRCHVRQTLDAFRIPLVGPIRLHKKRGRLLQPAAEVISMQPGSARGSTIASNASLNRCSQPVLA